MSHSTAMPRRPKTAPRKLANLYPIREDHPAAAVPHTSAVYAEAPVGESLPADLRREEFTDRQLLYLADWWADYRPRLLEHLLHIVLAMPTGCEVSPRRVGLNVLLLANALESINPGTKLGNIKEMCSRYSTSHHTVYEQFHHLLSVLRIHTEILGGNASQVRK